MSQKPTLTATGDAPDARNGNSITADANLQYLEDYQLLNTPVQQNREFVAAFFLTAALMLALV